jgi:hypothetical protein
MAVLTAQQALTLSNTANTLTDAQFQQQFPTLVNSIATATASGKYTVEISLNQSEFDRVRLFLTSEPRSDKTVRYTVRSNRDGAQLAEARLTRISWERLP